ncbi:hypothetical protein HUXLEY_164 [Erwinia phage vB_EamM_Huxley]|uniref:Lipoprotein n=2 Tax=Machinavirus machina TaxID=2169990 RepID=A0A1B2ID96_9CAUD|nr:hypothetical protein BIZ81_gp119 [Erwinia phage vB_EamM_Huxley]ANZ49246.1 hypothetical protein HUXLEY_164 [Erwinia phage vB_EamM_Huxley]
MMRKLQMLFVALIMLAAGCAMAPNTTDQFGTIPVAATEFTVYQCSAAKETFVKYQPQLGKLELMPFSVTVVDNGATWHASYPGGDVQTPQLYKDLLGKIDGSVDLFTGTRYYRLHGSQGKNATYSYSTVDPTTGNGEGMTFLQCATSPDEK